MTALIPTQVDLESLDETMRRSLIERSAVPDQTIRAAATTIVEDVRLRGDAALFEYGRDLGGAGTESQVLVDKDQIYAAYVSSTPEFIGAVENAITAITDVHRGQLPARSLSTPFPGVSVERRWSALKRVGIYVPGGGAAYPSSLLMCAIPAQIAGVNDIIVATPASATGIVDSSVLCAAHVLGLDRIYTMGGAQAIAAMACGTETVPRVDKIVGPGGTWVTAAKLAVYGTVGVDLPAGPSEAAVVVDSSTNAEVAASDLICQAEHGPDSVVLLIGTSRDVIDNVLAAASRQIVRLDRRDIIASALANHGLVVTAPSLPDALQFVEDWAPEHVSLLTENPARDAEAIESAGSVLLGTWTPESAGDYATGANHVLPTGGLARAYGPLSTEDFGSWRQIQEVSASGLAALAPTISAFAAQEGLSAHAACVDVRLDLLNATAGAA